MHWEHRCKFVLAAQGLAPAEVGSGAWIGPTLPGHVEGVAPFCPHLSLLLLPGGKFGGWGVGGWEGVSRFVPPDLVTDHVTGQVTFHRPFPCLSMFVDVCLHMFGHLTFLGNCI